MSSMDLLLLNHRLTTAELTYHMPDHPSLLQVFIWQEYDKPPLYPKLMKFIDFWFCSIDGVLHSVRVTHSGHLRIQEINIADFLEKYHS